MEKVNVIGAGLAGSEATYQLIKRGIPVRLYEMRKKKNTEAHTTDKFAELICSNSLRAKSLENAIGLLKEEMRLLDSLIMQAADKTAIEAGGCLAVDRVGFSDYITNYLKNHPLVEVIQEEVITIPSSYTIICSGPLTSEALSKEIKNFCGDEHLYFYDSVAPIVLESSIDKNIAYLKSRYDKGEASYYNCPMNEEQFKKFYHELINAETIIPHEFEMKVFEGCMAIVDMAKRGEKTLLFGPMKPVGLRHPVTNEMPYAVVQLRQDDASKTMYNIVGFQTHLKWSEQKRILQMIPGLEHCEIVRYGVMHRNTYIHSPNVLNCYYQTLNRKDLFFAGQMTGVEGYLESASSGMIAGINMARLIENKPLIDFPNITSIGSLAHYVCKQNQNFVPMNANFCLFQTLDNYNDFSTLKLNKKQRKSLYAKRSLDWINKNRGEICHE